MFSTARVFIIFPTEEFEIKLTPTTSLLQRDHLSFHETINHGCFVNSRLVLHIDTKTQCMLDSLAIFQTKMCIFMRLISEPLHGWFCVLIGILYNVTNHFLRKEMIERLEWCLNSICRSMWSWIMFQYVFGSTLLQFGVFRVGVLFDLHSFFFVVVFFLFLFVFFCVLISKNISRYVQIIIFIHNLIDILKFLFSRWFFL